MTIKLLLLKSGEDIIADVQEMVVGEEDNQRVIGYFLTKPCVVKMRDPSVLDSPENKEKQASYQVSLYPWMPLSKDKKIPLTAEWVVTMTEPIDKLNQMYIEDVIEHGNNNQSDTSNERSDTAEQD
jgi:hypothetical protein